jgi:hypothetical protein
MTRTGLTFRFQFSSQRAAYLRAVEVFLIVNPDLFADPKSAHVRMGRDGAILFAKTRHGMHQGRLLANGWYAETCLSNDQKVRILDSLAQRSGLKRGVDWNWEAENTSNPEFIDVDALLARL